eukprot:366496-Chlamydomonas_euryale.AAC.10
MAAGQPLQQSTPFQQATLQRNKGPVCFMRCTTAIGVPAGIALYPPDASHLERLDKRRRVHGLYLDDLVVQDGLHLVGAADDEGAGVLVRRHLELQALPLGLHLVHGLEHGVLLGGDSAVCLHLLKVAHDAILQQLFRRGRVVLVVCAAEDAVDGLPVARLQCRVGDLCAHRHALLERIERLLQPLHDLVVLAALEHLVVGFADLIHLGLHGLGAQLGARRRHPAPAAALKVRQQLPLLTVHCQLLAGLVGVAKIGERHFEQLLVAAEALRALCQHGVLRCHRRQRVQHLGAVRRRSVELAGSQLHDRARRQRRRPQALRPQLAHHAGRGRLDKRAGIRQRTRLCRDHVLEVVQRDRVHGRHACAHSVQHVKHGDRDGAPALQPLAPLDRRAVRPVVRRKVVERVRPSRQLAREAAVRLERARDLAVRRDCQQHAQRLGRAVQRVRQQALQLCAADVQHADHLA